MKSSTPTEQESGSKNPSGTMHHPDMDLPKPLARETDLTSELKEKVEVLLVTVTAIEWSAVFRKMKPVAGAREIFKVRDDKASYMVGVFGAYCIALIQSDDGSQGAHSVVNAALKCWNTKATILVGTCLSLSQNHKLGDVLVSQKLATYDRQRVLSSTQSNSLGLVIESGENLSPLFTKEAETHNWSFGNSTRHSGLMLSGSTTVESTKFADKLKLRYPEAVGLETEGDGVYRACRDNSQQWIVIKGVSGFPGATSENDDLVMKFAAAAATSLVLHVLSEETLKNIGCIAFNHGDIISQKTWNSKDRPVFVSFDQAFYNREHVNKKIVDGLLEMLKAFGLSVYVSNSTNSISTAQVERAVFLALVDHEFYLQSKVCMREMKRALNARQSSNVKVLPVLLSPCSKCPSPASDVSKLFGGLWQSEWRSEWKSYNDYLDVVNKLVLIAKEKKRCVFEDPSFGINTLAQEAATLFGLENVNASSSQLQQATPSLWRILHPIKECNPAKINDTTVDIHQSNFEKILHVLTSKDNSSVSIAGLKAAGGVGKTVLARRIANCSTVKEHFAPEGILWSEFGELDSTARPALERIYKDLGGMEKLYFDEDSTGQLMKARESFELLLARRKPTVLIVLDDVWKKKYLQVFKNVIKDANVKVLVTTRFKGMLEEVFGQENSIIDLNTFLSQDDALKMMNKYAGLDSVQKEDIRTMSKLAGHFGYHAKALAIVSARFNRFKTWENLLSSVEESKLKLDGAAEAKEWVFAAVKHTLAFALKENPDLIECYLQLGVLVEGARVSLCDLCVVWSCKIFEANAIANTLFECSVLEADESPKHDEDAVYYMHDLVRDCARQDKHATEKREKEFVQKLIFNFHNEQHLVTEYTIKYLPQHLPTDVALRNEVNNVYSHALRGGFDEKWSNTSCIVLAACASRRSSENALENAGLILCKRKGFLQRALDLRDHVLLKDCKWIRDVDAVKMFADALKATCRLRSLELYKNKIGDDAAKAIVNSLKDNSHCALEMLRLFYEDIKDDGVKSLAKWLEVNKTLTFLDIFGSSISVVGAKAIGEALEKNTTLQTLLLHNTKIGDIAATELAKCLNSNNSLQALALGSNNIGDDGAFALANALKVNSTLKELVLSSNNIGDDGATAFANSLKVNCTLQFLNLHNNNIGEAGRAAFSRVRPYWKPYWNRVST